MRTTSWSHESVSARAEIWVMGTGVVALITPTTEVARYIFLPLRRDSAEGSICSTWGSIVMLMLLLPVFLLRGSLVGERDVGIVYPAPSGRQCGLTFHV